jgi:hypothetical protein
MDPLYNLLSFNHQMLLTQPVMMALQHSKLSVQVVTGPRSRYHKGSTNKVWEEKPLFSDLECPSQNKRLLIQIP